MRRALLLSLAIVFAIACGDNVTEPIPNRTSAATPAVSFATTTTEDGLSISTDKDDYAPGDIVHLTGAGWPANDVLDIRLDDEPATHEPHIWTIDVADDGSFHDSSYAVDVGDLGVTFTLTATSQATGRSLTVTFTDAAPTVNSFTLNSTVFTFPASPPNSPATNPISVGVGATVTISVNGTTVATGGPNPNATWKSTEVDFRGGSINFGDIESCNDDDVVAASSVVTTNKTLTFSAPGTTNTTYDVRVRAFQGDNCTGTGGTLTYNGVLTVVGGPTKLAFTSSAFTGVLAGVVGQCLGAITVQTQNVGGTPTNVTSNTTVNLATDGTGAFYSDNTCTTGISSVSISTGSNSASFYYKATARGDGTHLLTASATGLTSATQEQTINKAATSTALSSSPNPSILNQSVTFTATVSVNSPGSGTSTGSVAFIEGGTCASPTTTHATVALSGGQASFNISTLAVGSHTIIACYPEGADFLASQGSVTHLVKYNFSGFFAPVDWPTTLNLAKAGQAIPLKWRLTDANLDPITNLTDVAVKVTALSCALGSSTDLVEEYAAGSSGLQNLGDGYYMFAWKTPTGYANSCKSVSLDFGSGYVEAGLANFNFRK